MEWVSQGVTFGNVAALVIVLWISVTGCSAESIFGSGDRRVAEIHHVGRGHRGRGVLELVTVLPDDPDSAPARRTSLLRRFGGLLDRDGVR